MLGQEVKEYPASLHKEALSRFIELFDFPNSKPEQPPPPTEQTAASLTVLSELKRDVGLSSLGVCNVCNEKLPGRKPDES